MDELTPSGVVRQVDRLVLGSGDGFLAEPLAGLRSHGVHVEVVASTGGVSRRRFRTSDRLRQIGRSTVCTHNGCLLTAGRRPVHPGRPLELVRPDLGADTGLPWHDRPALGFDALVDALDTDSAIDLVAARDDSTPHGQRYRQTRSSWVADLTVPRRLGREGGERLRKLDEPTAVPVERSLMCG